MNVKKMSIVNLFKLNFILKYLPSFPLNKSIHGHPYTCRGRVQPRRWKWP